MRLIVEFLMSIHLKITLNYASGARNTIYVKTFFGGRTELRKYRKKQHHEPSHDEDKKYVIVNQNKLLFLYFFFLSVVMLSNVSLNI